MYIYIYTHLSLGLCFDNCRYTSYNSTDWWQILAQISRTRILCTDSSKGSAGQSLQRPTVLMLAAPVALHRDLYHSACHVPQIQQLARTKTVHSTSMVKSLPCNQKMTK